MGQVWSKADFAGRNGFGNRGGRGSVLAVTTQNTGPDGAFGTSDDVLAPLNPFHFGRPIQGVQNSVDLSFDDACNDPNDRVREFASMHPGGANFLMADGSVRFITETIHFRTYQALSTLRDGEVIAAGF
jgi:prepilin-type processing-associated H-X9-DG protein